MDGIRRDRRISGRKHHAALKRSAATGVSSQVQMPGDIARKIGQHTVSAGALE